MLVLVGCNHRSAPVDFRERLAFPENELPRSLERLLERESVVEAMILSTCNRVEVLARFEGGSASSVDSLMEFIGSHRNVTREELDRHGYHFTGQQAVRHLFQVAAGLDSMILGEPQILGQVKTAYQSAQRCRATGPVFERLLQQCLSTAKRVRTETGISRNAVSVAFAAVSLASQIFGDLKGRRALLLGAGKMSELIARHLVSNGVGEISIASRTFTRAVTAADRFQATPLRWDDALIQLGEKDIVVACTGAQRPVLTRDVVATALRSRRGRPLFIIDIAVPRDVDPDVHKLDNVYLYDIDGLQGVIDANLQEREKEAHLARERIADDVQAFDRWRRSLAVTPTIVSLRDRLMGIGRSEFERFRGRLGSISSEQERVVDDLTRSIIKKVLHQPVVHLRESVDRGDVAETTSSYFSIFDLPSDTKPDKPPAAEGDRDAEARNGPRRVLRGGKDRRS